MLLYIRNGQNQYHFLNIFFSLTQNAESKNMAHLYRIRIRKKKCIKFKSYANAGLKRLSFSVSITCVYDIFRTLLLRVSTYYIEWKVFYVYEVFRRMEIFIISQSLKKKKGK